MTQKTKNYSQDMVNQYVSILETKKENYILMIIATNGCTYFINIENERGFVNNCEMISCIIFLCIMIQVNIFTFNLLTSSINWTGHFSIYSDISEIKG